MSKGYKRARAAAKLIRLQKFSTGPTISTPNLGWTKTDNTFFWNPPAWTITDPDQRIIEGYASLPNVDDVGEVIPLDVIAAALPSYMEWGNLREMHKTWAVGKVLEALVDSTGLWIKCQITDDDAWRKVQDATYQGFSVGGGYPRGAIQQRADGAKVITRMELDEISVVDRPANPLAKFDVVKMKNTPERFPICKLKSRGSPTMMHARGSKRLQAHSKRCKEHGVENCKQCDGGPDGTPAKPGMRLPAGKIARQKFIGDRIRAAARRLGIKTENTTQKMKTKKGQSVLQLDEALELVTDPEEKEQVTKAFEILNKAAGAPTSGNYGTEDMGKDPSSEAGMGIDLDPGEGEEEDFDIEEFLKAKQEDDPEEPAEDPEEDDEEPTPTKKAKGSDPFTKCKGHLAACHKALTDEEPHSACKSHLVKAMKSFQHCHKAFTGMNKTTKALDRKNDDKLGKIVKFVQKLDKNTDDKFDWVAKQLEEIHKMIAGLPASRHRIRPNEEIENVTRDQNGNANAGAYREVQLAVGR